MCACVWEWEIVPVFVLCIAFVRVSFFCNSLFLSIVTHPRKKKKVQKIMLGCSRATKRIGEKEENMRLKKKENNRWNQHEERNGENV